ncbi:MAG: acyl-CoA dehydrogenase [Labilithrix sp.]|nr:acyl-CoA dehydrogenase [Labilithrix sp.]MBX3213557.1 acyl-CoA dehydrogenase [Labilithrix sp.]
MTRSARDTALHERFLALGRDGLFQALSDTSSIEDGCRRLARLAHASEDLGVFLSIIAAAGLAVPILRRGASAHAEQLLEDALAGRAVLAVAITERGAGSDVAAIRTTLTRAADGSLRLDGSKWHITNAPACDAMIVFAVDATTDDRWLTAVVVYADDPGVRVGPELSLIGCKGSPTGEIWFDDVRVPEGRVLGRAREGRALLDLAFVRERILAPWPLIGKMERVIEDCLDHVEEREQFGRPIHEFQYVQDKIVSSFEELVYARHLAERALGAVARGAPQAGLASLAKAAAADAAVVTFRFAIEVFGAHGVQAERRYGDYLQDALCAQIAGGTRETHKKVVFGELRLERARARHRIAPRRAGSTLLRGEGAPARTEDAPARTEDTIHG